MTTTKHPDFGRRLSEAIQSNPVSAALIGMGLFWIATSASRATLSERDTEDSGPTTLAEAGAGIASAGQDLIERASDAVVQAASSSVDGAAALASRAGGLVQETSKTAQHASGTASRYSQNELTRLFERQPLVVGAFGLLIGAAVGSAIQATQAEREMFGEASEALRSTTDKLSTTVREAANSVAQEVTSKIGEASHS